MSNITTVQTNNVVDYYTDSEGDLFLKYFLIDSSFNTRGWSVDSSKIERLATTSIGAPFTDYEDFPSTLFNDGHPWNPKPKATFKDHFDYAAQKATGYIVDFSPVSRNALKSASGLEIQNNNGFYVTVKITDPKKKELYRKDPSRIPRVSAGILDHDNTPVEAGKTVLKNVDLVHLAGVKYGAYGEKARLYASCSGGYECVNHLKGASDSIDNNDKLKTVLENSLHHKFNIPNTDLNNSSLGENLAKNQDIMSDNQSNPLSSVDNNNASNEQLSQQNNNLQNNNEQQPAQQLIQPSTEIANNNNNNEVEQPQQQKAPFRLKTQKFDFTKEVQKPKEQQEQKEEVNKVPDWKQDKEYLKLAKEVEELRRERELEKQKQQYAELIPRELFILNGKFDVKGYNAELEKAVSKKIDPEYAKEFYGLKLEKLKLSKTGKPYGASASDNNTIVGTTSYKTPDTVPDNTTKGASDNTKDIISSQFAGLHNIRKMFGLLKEVSA